MGYSFFCSTKICFSEDASADLERELGALPAGRVFVLADEGIVRAGIVEPLLQVLEKAGRDPQLFTDIPGNPDVVHVNRVVETARPLRPAVILGIGGGSVIDVAKAAGILLAHDQLDWVELQWGRAALVQPPLPVIIVPTTAGTGSEVTHVAVIGDNTGFKKGFVHPAVFPRLAIVDGGLAASLPPNLTAATGMDAVGHAIEAYLGRRANPTTDLYALGALRAAVAWLPQATHHGDDLEARRMMAQAATWAGIAMDQAGLGLAHALCGPLAAAYHLHHGLGVALLLPPVLAFNAPEIPRERWEALRAAVGLPASAKAAHLADWMREFLARLGLPVTLREVGVERAKIEKMADEATRMAMIGNNIRTATVEDCRAILEEAL